MADHQGSLKFLGARLVTPYGLDIDRGENVFDDAGLTQQSVGNSSFRRRITVTLEPDRGDLQLGARYGAHREEHGYAKPFNLPVYQHEGTAEVNIIVAVRSLMPVDVGDTRVLLSTNSAKPIDIGTLFKFANANRIYNVTGKPSNSSITISPFARKDAPAGTQLDFNPINYRVKYAADSPEQVTIRGGIVTAVQFTVIEQPGD